MTRVLKPFAVLAVVVAFADVASAARPGFQVTILPTPDNCEAYSVWHGLAQNGDATGTLYCDSWSVSKAVVWRGNALSELASLGGPSSGPYGVGKNGVIVGMAETPDMYDSEYHVQRPTSWMEGVVRDLGTLGGPLGAATAVNAAGMIVGVSQAADDDPQLGRKAMRSTVWDGDSILDIGDLGGPESGAYDVNDRGWIVGSSTTRIPLGTHFEEHAFLYDGHTMNDLGTLGGVASIAWAINAAGDVVGYSYTGERPAPGIGVFHGFLWSKGTLIDLGTLGGPYSWAFDINDRGDIVGWSRLSSPGDHAVLWRAGEVIDLQLVSDVPDDCVLDRATAINNRGQILANARCGGRARVALLVPAK